MKSRDCRYSGNVYSTSVEWFYLLGLRSIVDDVIEIDDITVLILTLSHALLFILIVRDKG
ncbi:hypothetical protein [Beduini sp.]|uniref:hypothetical protein n=1 Tax=Beduini sp. TaxID=1922300 RepID=UPI003990801E